jgi:NAD(P)-dependent dehydrogenase (short-subunit alcohol dehydrogenase family)
MSVAGKTPEVVFIVGGHGGIGSALAARLVARGATVILAGRDEAAVRAAVGALQSERAHAVTLDARDFDATELALKAASERHGNLTAALNLAGSILLKPAHLTSSAEWADVLGTNLTTAISLLRGAAPLMGKAGGGSIVLMSSAAARIGLMNHDAIAAAKAGIVGLALASAATYAPRNVRVNVVAPGLVRTKLSARIVENETSRKASEGMHPLGRIGEPDDVAQLLSWLVEPQVAWVTGQVFGIDGGLGTVRSR